VEDAESAASRAATDGQLAAEPAAAPTTRTPSQGPRDRRAAVAELFTQHADAIFSYCFRMLRDPDRAEEVMQQVFLEALRDFEQFRGEAAPRTWLFSIASHRCLDELRALKRRASSDRIEPIEVSGEPKEVADRGAVGRGPFEQLDHAQLLQALEDCLTSLAPETRATVLLRFWTQLTHEQMTAHLGSTAEALQMRISRAMLVLRRCLENKGWAGE
jgi:RNA polymerase sigma-70 factor (ECF subfamily)